MGAELEFNSIQFEKKLTNLKDSQDSINAACSWCLEHKQFHKKIVTTWLSVLKRVKVDQRLTLFYLANDVIQYSKRKNYDFVESWGTALQKATTLVRDAKVKHKILRIFKIWEQRGVYGEEFISDLSGLISVSPAAKKIDESHEFQSAHLVGKIRVCAKLEAETDKKLQSFKQHNPKMQDGEALMNSLKDRAHVDDVEKEMNEYVSQMENYIEALRTEIKARNSLINLLTIADTQLEKDRKDVKVVAMAYKSFATRVKSLRKKLEEKRASLNSPIPSPDINAPSPSPDSDLDLPDNHAGLYSAASNSQSSLSHTDSYPNAGFYNQTQLTNDSTASFIGNMNAGGFSSFIGSGMTFNLNSSHSAGGGDVKTALTSLFPGIADPPPPPAAVPAPVPVPAPNTQGYDNYNNQMPLAPPPLPPFTNEGYNDYGNNYGNGYNEPDGYYNNIGYDGQGACPPRIGGTSFDEYNPEEDVETWENNDWDGPPSAVDTPASPPPTNKEPFIPPIEYHEDQGIPGAVDVDHRLMIGINNNSDKKEIDHRNLISLTGSPKETLPMKEDTDWHEHAFSRRNKDFRPSRPHNADNTESIDMDLSDDEAVEHAHVQHQPALLDVPKKGLLPPPPFPIDLDAYDPDGDEEWRQAPPTGAIGGERWLGGGGPPPGAALLGAPMTMPGAPRRGHPNMRPHANGGRGEFNNRGDFRDNGRGRFRSQGPSKFPPRGGGNGGGGGGAGWGSPKTRGGRGGRGFNRFRY